VIDMKMQLVADYAMDYLDFLNVPAEYSFQYMHVTISTDKGDLSFCYDDDIEKDKLGFALSKYLT